MSGVSSRQTGGGFSLTQEFWIIAALEVAKISQNCRPQSAEKLVKENLPPNRFPRTGGLVLDILREVGEPITLGQITDDWMSRAKMSGSP